MSLSVNQGTPFPARPVSNQALPASGIAKTLPYVAQLETSATDSLDLTNPQSYGTIDQVQSVFIDNADNGSAFSIRATTGQRVICPASTQGWFPLLSQNPARFDFASDGGVNVPVFFCNVPMPVGTWNSASSGGGPVVLTSQTVTSPNPAASFVIMPADLSRRYVMIGAPAGAALWVNPMGGSASVGGGDCFQIAAGGVYESGFYAWTDQISGFTTATGATIPAASG